MTTGGPPRLGKRIQPSGQQNRLKARERKQELRERQAVRIANGDSAPTFAVMECTDITRVHLHQLRRLLEAQEMLIADERIPMEERAKLIIATSHAMAKINTQAQLERELDEYKADVRKRGDQLAAAQAEALAEKHRMQQERAALRAERERLAGCTP
jgi:hypothetical protein